MRPTLEYHINIIVNGLYSNIVYCTYGVVYQNIVFKYYTVSFCKNKVAFIDAFFKKKKFAVYSIAIFSIKNNIITLINTFYERIIKKPCTRSLRFKGK